MTLREYTQTLANNIAILEKCEEDLPSLDPIQLLKDILAQLNQIKRIE